MESLFIPFRFCSLHAGGVHNLVNHLMKPIAFGLMSKETRVRVVTTYLKDEALVASLEKYGLYKEAIPVEMGGTCQYSHCEWLERTKSAWK